jgi:hypothetical protein
VAFDLKRFATLFGIVMTSAHDPEAINARNRLRELFERAGTDHAAITEALAQRNTLLATAEQLVVERDQALDQVERLKRRPAANLDPWSAAPSGSPQKQAAWLLDLDAEGAIGLNHFEMDFLTTIIGWDGAITAKQQPVFEKILLKFIRLAGRQPP